jgi:large subunit ribosomal protein L25
LKSNKLGFKILTILTTLKIINTMQTVAIEGTVRTEFGKKATKAMRKEGLVPCVAYGGGASISFSTKSAAFKPLIFTADFQLVEITVEGKSYRAILKDTQYHPVTDKLLHADFLLLVDGNTLTAEVPVRLRGIAPGTKTGGKLIQITRKVKIKTTPKNLVDHLSVNIESLELGKSVRVRDLDVVENVEVVTSPGIPLASVEIPRALRSAQTAAEKGEEEEV